MWTEKYKFYESSKHQYYRKWLSVKLSATYDIITSKSVNELFNPLHAQFSIGNNSYLQFISFVHTDIMQVVEILTRVSQQHTNST